MSLEITSYVQFIEVFLSTFKIRNLFKIEAFIFIYNVMSSESKCKMQTYFWKSYFIIKTSLSNLLWVGLGT